VVPVTTAPEACRSTPGTEKGRVEMDITTVAQVGAGYTDSFKTLERAFGDRLAAPKVLTDLVARGRFGVKTGSGFLELEPEKRTS
jgi:3-hydroxyacyl-CoA dehydrogenase